jgi:hypothetical protein
VPHRQPSTVPTAPEQPERRQKPRDPQASADWEQIVMQRMAGRIKSLTSDATAGAEGPGGGWEDTVVRRLQRRIQELDSKK